MISDMRTPPRPSRSSDAEPDIQTKALTIQEQASALTISDQTSYERAARKLRDVATIRKEITDYHTPLKTAAFNAHRAICDAEKKMLEPVAMAETILKNMIGAYAAEMRRIEEEQRRAAELEAARVADEKRRVEAEAAAAAAAAAMSAQLEHALENPKSEEETENILNAASQIVEQARQEVMERPVLVEVPRVEPAMYKASGVSNVVTYKAVVDDPMALYRAIADGTAAQELAPISLAALNRMAGVLKAGFNIPGCRVVTETSVRARAR